MAQVVDCCLALQLGTGFIGNDAPSAFGTPSFSGYNLQNIRWRLDNRKACRAGLPFYGHGRGPNAACG